MFSVLRYREAAGLKLRLSSTNAGNRETVTNLSMCFAVQVHEKIKHGARRDVTVFAPVISSIVVFKGILDWRRSRGADWRLMRSRSRRGH